MGWRLYIGFISFLICIINLSFGDEDVAVRPTFPDAFQVNVEGIFVNEKMLLDGTIYYDRENNRAAFLFTFQNQKVRKLYNFDDNELVFFDGNECEVSEIPDPLEGSFNPMLLEIPYTVDNVTGKTIGPPEDFLYFTKSASLKKGIYVLPTYVYEAKVDFSEYHLTNCTVNHIFTRPEVTSPDCDTDECPSTLLTISVNCPPIEEELNDAEESAGLQHYYNFHRFRSGITDLGVFQPPAGVFCNVTNHKEFPGFPDYFSFSYDFQEDIRDYLTNSSILATHHKVWYDSKLGLIRVDEFEDNGLLISSRIFDFNEDTAYTIMADAAECDTGSIESKVDLNALTRLPRLFFKQNVSEMDAIYIGKREAHGLTYDVWSASVKEDVEDSFHVEEFFFKKVISKGGKIEHQISHVDIYMYGRNPDTQFFELSINAYYSINNFRTKPKEWEAFDVSACFDYTQRKSFRLKVTGPTVVRNSQQYEDLLEHLYMLIISSTNVSVIRISELGGVYVGIHLNEFSGWILERPIVSSSENETIEPDMNSAYEQLKTATANGMLNMKFKRAKEEIQYTFTLIEENIGSTTNIKWAIAAIVLGSIVATFMVGSVLYYFLRRKNVDDDQSMELSSVN